MSTSEVSDMKQVDTMDFVLNLEVLNACAHHCEGCFVNRRNKLITTDLDTALSLASEMDEKGMRFREVILSPTDLFSADNAVEVLSDPKFHQLLDIHPKTRITTTAMFEDMDWDKWLAVWKVLDNEEFFRPNMIMEFLVPINPKKILAADPEYLAQFNRALDFMKNNTPKEVDWSFVINVHYDSIIADNYDEITRIAKEDFNTAIEFLPSFFRTGNDASITKHLAEWSSFLREVINEDNYRNTMLTIADKNHNSFNTIVINYKKGDLYISPFIYEQILYTYPGLRVDGVTAAAVIAKNSELLADQFKYATYTDNCMGCNYLSTCIGRNVLSFMEIKDETSCIYPKEILELYNANYTPKFRKCVGSTFGDQ